MADDSDASLGPAPDMEHSEFSYAESDDGADTAPDPVHQISLVDPGSGDPSLPTFTLSFRGSEHTYTIPPTSTLTHLQEFFYIFFKIPISNQKIMVPKAPMIKAPLKDPDTPLETLAGKRLLLMGTPTADVEAVNSMSEKVARRSQARLKALQSKASVLQPRRRNQAQAAEDAKYTFLRVEPLKGLPHPERSMNLLMRLKEDPGIRAAMRQHKFQVALLTEMEPLAHTQTTHEGTSRILGLNRNKGEVIELRLRTDAHDGYRDYKTIRNTLCHELAHNVHGPHDRQFWDLCHQIEREVKAADWKSGGQTVNGESSRSAYPADSTEEHQDHGGWIGGEYVLGQSSDKGKSEDKSREGMSRREILAEAALARMRKDSESECNAEKGWRPCQRPKEPNDEA
jgi:hypothetical protein